MHMKRMDKMLFKKREKKPFLKLIIKLQNKYHAYMFQINKNLRKTMIIWIYIQFSTFTANIGRHR